MFCAKCGRKLTPNAKNCSGCGAAAETAEYCGGFWGLVGEKREPAVQASQPRGVDKSRENTDTPAPKTRKKRPVFWYVVCLILLILLLCLSIRSCSDAALLRSTQESYTRLEALYQSLEEENAALTEAVAEIREDVQTLLDALQPEAGAAEAAEETAPVAEQTAPAEDESAGNEMEAGNE